jgi:hypothetical protein
MGREGFSMSTSKLDVNYIRVRQQTAAAGRTLVAQIILQFQVAF